MGYAGVDIDNTAASFEFDCIITSSHNLTEAAKNNILNYIYAEVYTELIPYLKQIKENIISITPLKDNQLLHIKVPAHTKFDPSYSYLILNGIPSNINTRLTPVFYNDMRPGEYVFGACNYSDYYAQFGLYYTIVDTN